MPFAKLGLTKPLLRGVQSIGCGVPTPGKIRAAPSTFEDRQAIASAPAGAANTAARPTSRVSDLNCGFRRRSAVIFRAPGDRKVLAGIERFSGQQIAKLARGGLLGHQHLCEMTKAPSACARRDFAALESHITLDQTTIVAHELALE
jgi:hypothetical protein